MIEVHVDTFARRWSRRFDALADALAYMDRLTMGSRFGAEVRRGGQLLACRDV